jgi:hypothetical protein
MSPAIGKPNEEEVHLPAENSIIIDKDLSENSIGVSVNTQDIRQEAQPQADANLSQSQEN